MKPWKLVFSPSGVFLGYRQSDGTFGKFSQIGGAHMESVDVVHAAQKWDPATVAFWDGPAVCWAVTNKRFVPMAKGPTK